MKKRVLICVGCVVLVLLFFFLFVLLYKENPEYLTLEIPIPQDLPAYTGEYAESEEFSTFVTNGSGDHYHYFVYRMYVPVYLGEKGFQTESDVENYYDGWLKKLGWKEQGSDLCNYDMREFRPDKSYRAYFYPTKHYRQPVACLAVWSQFDDGNLLIVLIKTINPSRYTRDLD